MRKRLPRAVDWRNLAADHAVPEIPISFSTIAIRIDEYHGFSVAGGFGKFGRKLMNGTDFYGWIRYASGELSGGHPSQAVIAAQWIAVADN